jgi:hypothetical protein
MRDNSSAFYARNYFWLLLLVITVITVICLFKPLLLSVDSTYGFLAYKGTLLSRSFNIIQDIPAWDINGMNKVFVSWWSPGQWIFPGILNYFFGTRLGIASIWITFVSLIIGFAGYRRVFTHYKFSPLVSNLSLLIIFSSSTLYYCFIIYQGGEVLEFSIFPWFLLYVIRIRNISVSNLAGVAGIFACCFIAKTTLLIYCTLVLIARIFQLSSAPHKTLVSFKARNTLLILPAILILISTYFFYLSRGPHPAMINHFRISPEGILIPMTSPVTSILSIQQWVDRIARILSGFINPDFLSGFVYIFYAIILIFLSYLIRLLYRDKSISRDYKSLFIILYIGLFVFFVVAYSFSANIDFDSRHFKLVGYLFIPGILTLLLERIKQFRMELLVLGFWLVALVDIIYLKHKWARNRYLSINYFYRSYQPGIGMDNLDKTSYNELMHIDQKMTGQGGNFIFFVESTSDIGIDLYQRFIPFKPTDGDREKIYHKSGPELIIGISKKTLERQPGILRLKFPDYNNFRVISKTDDYIFILGKNY